MLQYVYCNNWSTVTNLQRINTSIISSPQLHWAFYCCLTFFWFYSTHLYLNTQFSLSSHQFHFQQHLNPSVAKCSVTVCEHQAKHRIQIHCIFSKLGWNLICKVHAHGNKFNMFFVTISTSNLNATTTFYDWMML